MREAYAVPPALAVLFGTYSCPGAERRHRRLVRSARARYTAGMAEVTISLRHQPESGELPCGACGSPFIAAEDSGSRVFGLKSGAQEFAFLICGGCHSKWVHGTPIRIRSMK
jgi:hypothetical protein